MKQAPEMYRPKGGKHVIKLSKSAKRMAILCKTKAEGRALKKGMVQAETAYQINTDARLRLATSLAGGKE